MTELPPTARGRSLAIWPLPAAALDTWHRFVAERDTELLDVLLAPDVVFRAPTYWSERRGKPAVTVILSTVMTVFQDFRYHRQWIDGDDWALELRRVSVTSTCGGSISSISKRARSRASKS